MSTPGFQRIIYYLRLTIRHGNLQRRCWWEGMDLEGVEGVDGKLKVWIRRVWTLEMVSHCPPQILLYTNSLFHHLLAQALTILKSVIGLR